MISRPNPRRRFGVLTACVAVTLTLVAASAPAASAQDPGDASGTGLKAQYDEVLGAEARLEETIDEQTARRAEIVVEISQLEGKLAEVNLQLVAAERTLADAVVADRVARREMVAAQQRMKAATDDMHAQAVSAYINGGVSAPSADLMLGSLDGSNDAGRTKSYADAVVDHQQVVVAEYKAARKARNAAAKRSRTAKADATAVRTLIAASQRSLAVHRLEVEQLKQEANQVALVQFVALGQLRSKKIEIEARIVTLEKASDGIATLLAAAQSDQPDFEPGAITFASPLPGVSPGSPFGMRFHPILHYERLHAGIDFGAGSGTPIRAAAAGTVIIAGDRGGYGNAVVIDHGDSVATVYAHQSQIAVRVGQVVEIGDVIGAVGTTGLSTGPHLHFETRLRGTPVNPTNFIDFEAELAGSRPGG